MSSISFFGNDRETQEYEEAYHQLSSEVWKTGQYLNGPWVKDFEENIARKCQRKYAVALSSCTDALIFGLRALNILPGSDVVVPDFSFIASASPILHAQLNPVFCDVDEETAMMTRNGLMKEVVKGKTKAVIAVSLFGAMAPLEELQKVCSENDLYLIEDAAQSLGATLNHKPAGSFGEFSTLSFDPTKTLHGLGAGGCLLTNSASLYKKVCQMRLHGRDESLNFSQLGRKSLLPSIDANILNFKLSKISDWIEKRREIAFHYNKVITGNNFLETFISGPHEEHSYHKFVLKCRSRQEREQLKKIFLKENITVRIHYDKPISHHEVFSKFKKDSIVAYNLSERVLSLPIYHELHKEEVQRIADILRLFRPE